MPCLCAESVNPQCPVHGFDLGYWGPGGVNVSGRWTGFNLQRGCDYKNVGPTTDGAKDQRRSISSGRKARGMSSDDYQP